MSDCSIYRRLSFVAAAPGEPSEFKVRIKDIWPKESEKQPARFYKTFVVGPEPERYTINFAEIEAQASDGPFDFSRVQSILLTAAKPGSRVEILLDDFRLEK